MQFVQLVVRPTWMIIGCYDVVVCLTKNISVKTISSHFNILTFVKVKELIVDKGHTIVGHNERNTTILRFQKLRFRFHQCFYASMSSFFQRAPFSPTHTKHRAFSKCFTFETVFKSLRYHRHFWAL